MKLLKKTAPLFALCALPLTFACGGPEQLESAQDDLIIRGPPVPLPNPNPCDPDENYTLGSWSFILLADSQGVVGPTGYEYAWKSDPACRKFVADVFAGVPGNATYNRVLVEPQLPSTGQIDQFAVSCNSLEFTTQIWVDGINVATRTITGVHSNGQCHLQNTAPIILDIAQVGGKTMQIQMSARASHPSQPQYDSAYRVRAKVIRSQAARRAG